MPMMFSRFCCAVTLVGAISLYAADKSKPAPAAAADPYTEVQPATECLDLNMYQRIRGRATRSQKSASKMPTSKTGANSG